MSDYYYVQIDLTLSLLCDGVKQILTRIETVPRLKVHQSQESSFLEFSKELKSNVKKIERTSLRTKVIKMDRFTRVIKVKAIYQRIWNPTNVNIQPLKWLLSFTRIYNFILMNPVTCFLDINQQTWKENQLDKTNMNDKNIYFW